MSASAQMRAFVLAWLTEHEPHRASVCHTLFHDAFHERFGGRRAHKLYGAMPVFKAMRLLRAMHHDGMIDRCVESITIGEFPPGFPNWIYTYGPLRKAQ